MSIDDLVSRKQVELLGGGFYEPQFSLIPLQDKIGQIEMLTTYLRRRFGRKPQGCWLPDLNWEQNFVAPLASCGMAYTFLGEESFRQAGLSETYGPCLSEDQGKMIVVFPLALSLNRFFAPREEAAAPLLDALKNLARGITNPDSPVVSVFPDPCRTMESSGEAELYWHRFIEGLADSVASFDFTTPGRFIKGRPNLQKAYFPSSVERRCLVDFPEANGIYAKMVFSHMLINQLRGDKSRKRTALEELWKAQGYDAFCPAESGGVYRGDLRKSAYHSMLEAEKITRETGAFIPCLMNFDFDLDNEDEYLLQGEQINCYVRPEGAGVFELDYLPRAWNYMDTFVPHPGEPGQRTGNRKPPERRAGFSDLLLDEGNAGGENSAGPSFPGEPGPGIPPPPEEVLEALAGSGSRVRRCYDERFQVQDMDKTRCRVSFVLPETNQGPFGTIRVKKHFQLRKDTLTVAYTLSNRGGEEEHFRFIPELDLSFSGDGEEYQRIFANGAPLVLTGKTNLKGVELLKFQDLGNETIITLGADKGFDGWIFPLYCPVPAAQNIPPERSYQSTCIAPLYHVHLDPGESWTLAFSLKFTH
jgi:hypothetical protein